MCHSKSHPCFKQQGQLSGQSSGTARRTADIRAEPSEVRRDISSISIIPAFMPVLKDLSFKPKHGSLPSYPDEKRADEGRENRELPHSSGPGRGSSNSCQGEMPGSGAGCVSRHWDSSQAGRPGSLKQQRVFPYRKRWRKVKALLREHCNLQVFVNEAST